MSAAAGPLTDAELESFVTRGFVRLPEAFPRALADECRAFLWDAIGLAPDRPDEWTRRVIWLTSPSTPAFDEVVRSPRLNAAFDQLVGAGRWQPLEHLGGSIPVRFPVDEEPDDDGWHIDHSFPLWDWSRINVRSEGRALLLLVLFSDVGGDDAPTRIKVGSHLDVPAALVPFGEEGTAFDPTRLPQLAERPIELATGAAGDVYLCHPFLVHAADRHRGRTPRFMAQPGLPWRTTPDLDAPADDPPPVERAIRLGLER